MGHPVSFENTVYDICKTKHKTESGLYHFISALSVCMRISNINRLLLKKVKSQNKKRLNTCSFCVILFRYRRSLCIYCYLLWSRTW